MPEQLGEALRDVVVPLQPPEGVQANRDAVEQGPPPQEDTLQENNNVSVEEAPPPQPFPGWGERGNHRRSTARVEAAGSRRLTAGRQTRGEHTRV